MWGRQGCLPQFLSFSCNFPGADPGFPVGGEADRGRGRRGGNIRFCQKVQGNLHEIENNLGHGGASWIRHWF